ncbi:MAG: VTT domain-containing protein, partial [Trueperaceae bacterium]
GRVAIWMRQFRKRTFESVLVARVLGVPGDVVNVAAGAGRVPFVPFATATAVGGSPYLVAFALAGAALEESFGPDAVGFRWELAVIAVAVGAVGLLAATWLRHRRTRRDGDGRNGAGRNGTGERDGTGEGDRAR